MKSTHPCLITAIVMLFFVNTHSSAAFQSTAKDQPQSKPVASDESDKPNKKLRMNLKLDFQRINTIRSAGSISSVIPPKNRDRVGAIRLQQPTSFLSKPLVIVEAKANVSNGTLYVEVDNTILERLPYQPVELRIYDTGFNAITLKFNPKGMVAGKLPEEVIVQPGPKDSPILYVSINGNRGIYGVLEGFKELDVKAEFGKIKIPVDTIAGIRFNTGPDNQTYIVLKKGDSFSGKIELEKITISTRWGKRDLKVANLESVTTFQSNKFVQTKNNPDRWQLKSTLQPILPNQPLNSGTLQEIR